MVEPREPGFGAGQGRVLLGLSLPELEAELAALSQPPFRARQVYRWLHNRGVPDPQRMTDLPEALRQELARRFDIRPLKLARREQSADGSLKLGFTTSSGAPVEAVLMPGFSYGTALCISVQSGCPLGCTFCETGRLGLLGNLGSGAILQQLYDAEAESGLSVDRLVVMGMGEPLLRLDALKRAFEALLSPEGRGWAARRITVSTVGLFEPIIALADGFPRVNLALSLHFTTAKQRAQFMPKAEPEPARLARALYYYRRVNGGKLTVEYMLLDKVNDSNDDLERLVRFTRLSGIPPHDETLLEAESHPPLDHQQPLPLHVNLLEYNPVPGIQLKPAGEQRIDAFARRLSAAGVSVSVRRSRGRDIGAACGQLGRGMLQGRGG